MAEAKSLAGKHGLAIDPSRELSAIAAETLAAAGDLRGAQAEYDAFQASFPLQRQAPLARLSLALSKARTLSRAKRWQEVEGALVEWTRPQLADGREIPLATKGEMLLLLGEARLARRTDDAVATLEAAEAILRRSDVPGSARLQRVLAANQKTTLTARQAQ